MLRALQCNQPATRRLAGALPGRRQRASRHSAGRERCGVHEDLLGAFLSRGGSQDVLWRCRLERAEQAMLLEDAQGEADGQEGRRVVRAGTVDRLLAARQASN